MIVGNGLNLYFITQTSNKYYEKTNYGYKNTFEVLDLSNKFIVYFSIFKCSFSGAFKIQLSLTNIDYQP